MPPSMEASRVATRFSWLGADAAAVRGSRSPWRSYVLAVLMMTACGLISAALQGRIDEAHLILVFLLGTLPVALRGDRGAAITAAFLAIAAFDVFFVPPRYTLAVADPQYLFTFAVMGLFGVIISSLTAALSSDVHATRQFAIEHARARAEAEEARLQAETERLRSALLSSVSHDLRTPLTGIVGAASALVDGVDALSPQVRRELAQGIVEEADRMTRLVTNLLQATRLDAGEPGLARVWFPIEEAVSPALARLGAAASEHPIALNMPPDLPLVWADPVLLAQVFTNLLENAAKHTPPGTPIAVSVSHDGAALRVEVADEGAGLPAGDEERVFEKFYRSPGGAVTQGTGLGLAIARGVIEAHGGSIQALNRAEGGASFRFSLPAVAAPAPVAAAC